LGSAAGQFLGTLWTYQIDIAGINTREKTLLLGECKWLQTPAGRGTLSALLEKTAQAVPTHGKWWVMLMGFSPQGWTQPALDLAEEITSQAVGGITGKLSPHSRWICPRLTTISSVGQGLDTTLGLLT
jgi:hypothetical protein